MFLDVISGGITNIVIVGHPDKFSILDMGSNTKACTLSPHRRHNHVVSLEVSIASSARSVMTYLQDSRAWIIIDGTADALVAMIIIPVAFAAVVGSDPLW